VNPDIVRVAGRWAKGSRSFGRYWRKEDEIVPKHVANLVVSGRRRRTHRG
jgi:hypothetical protein